jgi:hypothetical protein
MTHRAEHTVANLPDGVRGGAPQVAPAFRKTSAVVKQAHRLGMASGFADYEWEESASHASAGDD